MSGKSDEDPSWTLFLMFIMFVVAGWIIWSQFGDRVLHVMRYLRIAEMFIINVFTHEFTSCINWMMTAYPGKVLPSTETVGWALMCFGDKNIKLMQPSDAMNYYNITTTSMGAIADRLSVYTRWPAAVGCIMMFFYAFFVTKRNKFKTKYNLESFIKLQATMWPVISPIVKFNPTKHSARIQGEPIPDKLPIFAEALSPEEWISFHKIPVTNGIPDREATRRALQMQLGPKWNGIKDLPLPELALFCAFALKGAQKREESDDFLGRISQHWSQEKGMVFPPELKTEIKKIANNPDIGGKAAEIADKYAFRTTAFLGVLKWARFMGGVLAPGQFVWLRAVNRDLWYPLNNLGRRSFHTEGAGAMAHFMAEESAQKPLPIPRVDTALVTINQYMGRGNVEIPPHATSKK